MPKCTLARATATRCSHTHTVHLIPSLISASGGNNHNWRFLEGTVADLVSACNFVPPARAALASSSRLLAPAPPPQPGGLWEGGGGVIDGYYNATPALFFQLFLMFDMCTAGVAGPTHPSGDRQAACRVEAPSQLPRPCFASQALLAMPHILLKKVQVSCKPFVSSWRSLGISFGLGPSHPPRSSTP